MFRVLFATDALAIDDYRCEGGHASDSGEELSREFELVFVRHGVFNAVFRNDAVLMSPAHALLLRPDSPYRVSHPIDGSDACTVFRFSRQGWDMAGVDFRHAYRRPRAIPTARAFLTQQRLVRMLCASAVEELDAEERAWSVVEEFRGAMDAGDRASVSAHVRRAVARAQELITARYRERLPLRAIAAQSGLSQFHLSRAFRRLNGITMHRFQVVVRLRAALIHLDEGATDLTELALDLGFADHSHFCAAFQREFGIAPSAYRAMGAQDRIRSARESRSTVRG